VVNRKRVSRVMRARAARALAASNFLQATRTLVLIDFSQKTLCLRWGKQADVFRT